jgi:hypothetical protein
MNPCKKLRELPPVLTEWQGAAWCPDCPHYDGGACAIPTRTHADAPCPLDGQPLPLREVAVDPGKSVPEGCLHAAPSMRRRGEPRCEATEQAIRDAVASRTGARVQLHEVEVRDGLVVIRGRAPCYYVTQLAITAVVQVVGDARPIRVDLKVPAAAGPASAEPAAAREELR